MHSQADKRVPKKEAGRHGDEQQVLIRAVGMPRSLKVGGGHAVQLRRAGWVLEHEAVGLRVIAAYHDVVPCSGMHSHTSLLLPRLPVQLAQTRREQPFIIEPYTVHFPFVAGIG